MGQPYVYFNVAYVERNRTINSNNSHIHTPMEQVSEESFDVVISNEGSLGGSNVMPNHKFYIRKVPINISLPHKSKSGGIYNYISTQSRSLGIEERKRHLIQYLSSTRQRRTHKHTHTHTNSSGRVKEICMQFAYHSEMLNIIKQKLHSSSS